MTEGWLALCGGATARVNCGGEADHYYRKVVRNGRTLDWISLQRSPANHDKGWFTSRPEALRGY